MRKHAFARFVATLLFIVAAVIFLIAVFAAIRLSTGGLLGGGWGLGWNGWMVLPILISATFSAGFLALIGAAVYFLLQIESNLTTAVELRRNRPPVAPVPARPTEPVAPAGEAGVPEPAEGAGVVATAAETAGTAAAGAVAVGALAAGAVAGGAAADETAAEQAPTEEAEAQEPAAAEAAAEPGAEEQPGLAEQAGAVVEGTEAAGATAAAAVTAGALAAGRAATEEPEAETPEGESVPASEVTPAETGVQAPRVEIMPTEDELAAEEPGNNGAPPAETPVRLPGTEQAARIAAEMAALNAAGAEAGAPAEGAQPLAGDDLTAIEGVGPVYARRLQEAGITTYAELAAASDMQLDQLTDGNLDRVNREDWRGQAARLAKE